MAKQVVVYRHSPVASCSRASLADSNGLKTNCSTQIAMEATLSSRVEYSTHPA